MTEMTKRCLRKRIEWSLVQQSEAWYENPGVIMLAGFGHVQAGDRVQLSIGLQSHTIMCRPGAICYGLNWWDWFWLNLQIKIWRRRTQ